ncbi:MAG: ABC transporter substrate-binding protein [Eubacteriales bacterium]|nr:ABC transporter substrate-binding protein [Eubacteriales bacterium]
MKFKKMTALALASVMAMSLVACGGNQETPTGEVAESESSNSQYDTIVIGNGEMNGVFNPFFYTTAFDNYAFSPVFDTVVIRNDNNELEPHLGEISLEEIKDEAGETKQVKYTIKLKEGVKFSDGEDVTIDDLLFTYYVMADPSYDGMSTFRTLNIVGINEYYYDSPDYATKMEEFKETAANISDEEVNKYIEAMVDNDIKENTAAAVNESLGLGIDPNVADLDAQVRAKYIEISKADESNKKAAAEELFNSLKKGYINDNLADGIQVTEISGIERVDDYTCTVLVDGVNIIGDRLLAEQTVMPQHYYGVADDGTEFQKGDMTIPKSRNSAPMGTGAYIFKKYENNLVELEANPNYFKGAPKTPYLKLQVVSDNNKVDVVLNQEMDITDPSAQKETMAKLEENGVEYNLTDNNGYGYIGINAERVSDINVRKGLMHLMNRKPAIDSYYGELAQVLERPMTSTLAEYPQDAVEYYGYDKAKALEYFEKAGYTKDANGKLVDSTGKQLKIEVGVGDLSSHPSAGILSQMKTDMDEMGAELIISDLQGNVLFDRVKTGDLDMFVMAWSNSNHADLKQIFHSESADGSGSNHFKLRSPELDALLEEVSTTLDLEKRKELVAKELDLIMENAVVMPVYQRKNLTIFNGETLNMDTVYRSNSPYHTFREEMYLIEMR